MTLPGRMAMVIAAALLGVLLGYGVMISIADPGPYPVEPIELGPGPTATTPTSSPEPFEDTTSPTGMVVPPPTVVPIPPTQQPPPPPSSDDDDDDDTTDDNDDDSDDGEDDD